MSSLVKFYNAQLRVEVALKMQYRVATLLNMLQMAVEPVIYMVVWRTVALAQGGAVGDFTPSALATYYIIFTFMRQFVAATGLWLFEWRIREGHMSTLLLRPLHPIHADIAENISYKLFSSLALVPVLLVMALAFEAQFTAPWWLWLLFALAACLGAAIRFIAQYALAMIGFWTTRLDAIWQMYSIAQTFFGGTLAPLALLPAPLLFIASLLPFRWILAFPIELAMGRLSSEVILGGFVAQMLWIIGLTLLMIVGWRVAVERYGAVGG
ncbi:MAG: ABC-2 family transporter protein [Chloroflexi bacterium]|nr:ABC-2 family transporter protein [Chloroflexota bacterium]